MPFALRLLGGVALLHPDGRPVVGRAAHRHPLALLARLALAPPDGLSREKLSGLLWSERDEAAARHRLRGAIHELRQLLGADALRSIGPTVRLAPDRVQVDVRDLLAAQSSGDSAAVVALYGGPFLDGFFLEDSEEFEEWARAERARMAAIHAEALERLALQAAAAGEPLDAVRWWQALTTQRPGDGRVARATFDTLVTAGDTGGALAHAIAHARYLRQEFGVAPDAEFRMVVAALRQTVGTPSPDDETLPLPERPTEALEKAVAAPHRSIRRWIVGAGVLVGLAAALVAIWSRRDAATAPSRDAPTALAVAPFQVVAGVPENLGDGLALLLSTTLDQVPELRLVRGSTALFRSQADSGGATASLAVLRRVAGAELLVEGVVAPAGPGMIAVTASLIDSAGVVRTRIRERGAVADLAGVVDHLALALLRELWGRRWGVPSPRAGSVLTDSAGALRAFLRGEAFLRAAAWDSATAAFVAAGEIDSTFALAELRLAETYGWRNRGESAEAGRALAAAARHADRLAPRERGLLELRRLHDAGDMAALEKADALAARYPADPEVRYVQADVRFHADGAVGRSGRAAVIAAFDTALALDSTSARVLVHPFTMALWQGDRVRYERISARLAALNPDSISAARRALVAAVRFSPPDVAARALADGLRRGARAEWWLDLTWAINGAILNVPAPRPDLLIAALDGMRAAFAGDAVVRQELDKVRLDVRIATGRLSEARPLLDAEAVNAYVLLAFGQAPTAWHNVVTQQLERETPVGDANALHSWELPYRRALLAIDAGDIPVARRELAAAGRQIPTNSRDAADSSQVRAVHGLLRAAGGWVRLAEGDTAGAQTELDAGLHAVGYVAWPLRWSAPLMVVRARLLAAGPRRAQAMDQLPVYQGGGIALAAAYAFEAGLRAAEGDEVAAAAARARAAALWSGADSDARGNVAIAVRKRGG